MSQDRSEADGSGDLEPGGGPRRVVSEQSVDDILDSLDDAPDESDRADDTPDGATDGSDSSSPDPDPEDEASTGVTADHGPKSDGEPSAEPAETSSEPSTADPGTSDGTSEDDGSSPVDAGDARDLASDRSTDDDRSVDDLAARVETGDVTGADVRAAEAGDGREATPDVEAIDLSMDDLEDSTGSGGASATDGASRGDDAGPLAGTVDPGPSDDAAEDDVSGGLFDRVKSLFGR